MRADTLKPCQLLGVDLDHAARLRPLVPADWLSGLQFPQAPKPNSLEPTPNRCQRYCQVFVDAPYGALLMALCLGLLLLRWIDRPPLGAANTASIHQCRHGACAVPGKPLVPGAEADP